MKKVFLTLLMAFAYLLAWADNSVTVTYNGNTATVTVDDNVAQYLTVTHFLYNAATAFSSFTAASRSSKRFFMKTDFLN